LAGFACLPTDVPESAARELERAVTRLGFRGAMVHGLSNGEFLDLPRFRPIFEAANALEVPIYIHPATPLSVVSKAYYADYENAFPSVVRPAWGFTVETATQAIRLVLSGLFETCSKLQIVLGHLGETLPYLLWRITQALSRPGQNEMNFRRVFTKHFNVTTSGNFSTPALQCAMLELGVERIMFSVDWPFVPNGDGIEWMRSLQIADADFGKVLGQNARRLLKL
jgi:2,3-dihydroxybenzoate decarboxylase